MVNVSSPVLRVSHLKKSFGSFVAVDDISFDVQPGEILGFLGPNGAGKTTTIAMILGLIAPSAGSISIFDQDMQTHRQEILAQMNYQSAYTKVPWRLKVYEYLSLFAKLYNVSNPKEKIAEMLEIFELTQHRNTLGGDLSAGNMARVNLAKAFINSPKLVLLDEPTSSLDPDVADIVRKYVLKAQEEQHTSVLLTSHNMMEIEELCDRVIFVNHGHIIAEGTPEKLAGATATTNVKLLMKDGQKRTISYCQKHHLSYDVTERSITIHVAEKQIATLLHGLAQAGVTYTEVSINRPTLEDFFIGEARHGDSKKKN